MTACHLALSPRRKSTSELLGAVAVRRGMVPVEVSHSDSKRSPAHATTTAGWAQRSVWPCWNRRWLAANCYVAAPDLVLDAVLAAAHPAWETAERDREFGRPA